jgi:hypothetical protein
MDGDLPRSRFAVSPADRLCLDLAALTIAGQSLATTLSQVAELGRRMLPAAVGMSVALLDDRHRCTFAGSGPLAAVLDERQYQPDYGPGIAAAALGREIEVVDTATDVIFIDFSPCGLGQWRPPGGLGAGARRRSRSRVGDRVRRV